MWGATIKPLVSMIAMLGLTLASFKPVLGASLLTVDSVAGNEIEEMDAIVFSC
jgi:hypothetical protein